MDLTEQVEELFHHNINSMMRALDSLPAAIARASELMVQRMLCDNKVLCCGEGSSALIAQQMATYLINHFHYERPSLPALSIGHDGATVTAISSSSGYSDIFAKQIRAVGQQDDILLCCFQGEGSSAITSAIQAAHERGLTVITLSNIDGAGANSLLHNSDIELRVPGDNLARSGELQLFTVHALCELIDQQLFGNEV